MSAFSRLSMIEAAAIFLGHLAHPGHPKAEELAGVLICTAVDHMVATPDEWGEPPELLRLACRLRDRTRGEAMLKNAARIISGERLVAAKMAWPKLHSAVCDDLKAERPAFVPGPTSKEMIAAVGMDLDATPRDGRGRRARGASAEGNKSNIRQRCWKSSLPVLHLALSYALEAHEAGIDGFSIGDLLVDSDLVERMIRRSIDIGPIAASTFGIADQVTIVPLSVQKNGAL